jgi:hypothetical protein
VIDLPESLDCTPPRRPWRGGGWLAGDKKTLNFLYYAFIFFVVIEALHLL